MSDPIPSELVELSERLRAMRAEMIAEGHNGWPNTVTLAIDLIERLTSPPVGEDAPAWLSVDDAETQLLEAINAIRIGNKTDDKLILANLRKAGVWLARFNEGDEQWSGHVHTAGASASATIRGMVPWRGGDCAPEDWDGGDVLLDWGDDSNSTRRYTVCKAEDIDWNTDSWRSDLDQARYAIIIAYTPKATVAEATAAFAGWRMVPVEPTETMLAAAGEVNFDNEDERAMACNVWNAMISAVSLPVAGRKVERALIRLEAAATLVTEWLDRINDRDGTALGGPQWFELGRAVTKAREALSTAPSPSPVSGCRVCGAAIPSAELCDGCAQGNDPFQQSKYGESRA